MTAMEKGEPQINQPQLWLVSQPYVRGVQSDWLVRTNSELAMPVSYIGESLGAVHAYYSLTLSFNFRGILLVFFCRLMTTHVFKSDLSHPLLCCAAATSGSTISSQVFGSPTPSHP